MLEFGREHLGCKGHRAQAMLFIVGQLILVITSNPSGCFAIGLGVKYAPSN